MVLEYDFDIVTIDADDTNSGSAKTAAPGGMAARAFFRRAETAAALRATSPKIRLVFEEAGFGLESTNSNLAHGYYRLQDTVERDRILHALFANIRAVGVKGEYCGEFDIRQFLNDVKSARPQDDVPPESQNRIEKPQQSGGSTPKRRSVQGRIGLALALAVVVIAVLRYLAAAGATP